MNSKAASSPSASWIIGSTTICISFVLRCISFVFRFCGLSFTSFVSVRKKQSAQRCQFIAVDAGLITTSTFLNYCNTYDQRVRTFRIVLVQVVSSSHVLCMLLPLRLTIGRLSSRIWKFPEYVWTFTTK